MQRHRGRSNYSHHSRGGNSEGWERRLGGGRAVQTHRTCHSLVLYKLLSYYMKYELSIYIWYSLNRLVFQSKLRFSTVALQLYKSNYTYFGSGVTNMVPASTSYSSPQKDHMSRPPRAYSKKKKKNANHWAASKIQLNPTLLSRWW